MGTQLDDMLQFHSQALNLRAKRQELLASNIANADTPGYKARDINFNAALSEAIAGRLNPSQLARTAPGHLTPGQQGGGTAGQVQYRSAVQPTLDGNTVDMDVERAQFAENAIHYEASLMFINGKLKSLLAAIQG